MVNTLLDNQFFRHTVGTMTNCSNLFPDQPAAARVWIYTANRSIAETELERILRALGRFLDSWTSHEQPVVAEATAVDERFLIVAAHIPGGDVSGCGIDKLDHAVTGAGDEVGVEWLNGLTVLYRSETGDISAVSRSDFRGLVAESLVGAETTVFDTSTHSLSELRLHGLERVASESWHGSVFQIESTVGA